MDDLISRQAAIDAIKEKQLPIMRSEFLYDQAKFDGLSVALNIITELSSAQPKRIKGQWSIKGQAIDTVRGYWATCSACGHAVFGGGNYCPNCGSYNKGEVIT